MYINSMNKRLKQIIQIFVAIVIAELAGIIGSIFTSSSVSTWYLTLNKPFFNPPSWVFAPVWTILFALMGLASYFIFIKGFKNKNVKIALGVYGTQLIFNIIWSVLFFGLKNPLFAFIEILILLTLIVVNTFLFWKIDKRAGYIMLPYILWVSFATLLNLAIFILN